MLDTSKVGFSAFWFDGLRSAEDVARVCNELAVIGYRGVEWKETCFGSGKDARDRLKMASEATRAAGLEVTDFVILRSLTNPEQADATAEDICEYICAAAGAGVNTVNTASGGVLPKVVPDDEWWRPAAPDWQRSWDTLEKILSKALKVAEAEGVKIVFETILGTLVHDYYSTLELLRRLESPSLALTLDPSHYVVHDNDIGCAIRQLGSRIGLVHVKDAVGRPGVISRDFIFPILGEGAMNWQEFFAALDDIGYTGWLSIEFESFKYMTEVLRGDAVEAARLSMRSYKALAPA